MQLTHHSIDLEACWNTRRSPCDMITRDNGEQWLVPFAAIQMDKALDWRHFKRNGKVHIPMFPYLLPTAPDLALGYMLQLGLRCAFDFGRPVQRLHLATGTPVNEILDEYSGERCWQYWVGLGLVLEQ